MKLQVTQTFNIFFTLFLIIDELFIKSVLTAKIKMFIVKFLTSMKIKFDREQIKNIITLYIITRVGDRKNQFMESVSDVFDVDKLITVIF